MIAFDSGIYRVEANKKTSCANVDILHVLNTYCAIWCGVILSSDFSLSVDSPSNAE